MAGDEGAMRKYAVDIIREASERKSEIAESISGKDCIDTLYIGGGTPSVLPPSVLSDIVSAIEKIAHPEPRAWDEFTIEVNPEDIVEKGMSYVKVLKDIGVTRVSMGVQSFDDSTLRWMNRRHDSQRALQAYRMLGDGGFDNISIDLIFGIGGMTSAQWADTLEQALAIGSGNPPRHISAYQLSIEEDSVLDGMCRRGKYKEASDEECREQYEILCRRLAEAGYHHYEVSNFALPGYEARHNSGYWRRIPYIGLGPGAHSFSGNIRSWNTCEAGGWTCESETLDNKDVDTEIVMLALRTSQGLPEDVLRKIADASAVDRLLSNGALVRAGGCIRIPETHFFVSDEIIREIYYFS